MSETKLRELPHLPEAVRLLSGPPLRVWMSSHERPDGDACGSLLALGLGLQSLGHQVWMQLDASECHPASNLPIHLLRAEPPPDPESWARVLTDCGQPHRSQSEGLRAPPWLMLIDHHEENPGGSQADLIDVRASSACELVWRLLRELGAPLTLPIAECLWTGLVTDTGSFQFEKAGADSHLMAAELIHAGVQPQLMAEAMHHGQPRSRLQAQSRLLDRVHERAGGQLLAVLVEEETYQAYGKAATDSADVLLRQLLYTERVKIACALKFKPSLKGERSGWTCSLRSASDGPDVAALAASRGGGGHFHAAGFKCEDPGEVLDWLERFLLAEVG